MSGGPYEMYSEPAACLFHTVRCAASLSVRTRHQWSIHSLKCDCRMILCLSAAVVFGSRNGASSGCGRYSFDARNACTACSEKELDVQIRYPGENASFASGSVTPGGRPVIFMLNAASISCQSALRASDAET